MHNVWPAVANEFCLIRNIKSTSNRLDISPNVHKHTNVCKHPSLITNIYKMYKNMINCDKVLSPPSHPSRSPTTVSTPSLRWPQVQQVTCDVCFVHSEEPERRWERERQTVRPALARPGNHHTASWLLRKGASLSCFCKASVVLRQGLESVCWSGQVQEH